jgi:hypothetical protein
MTEKPVTIGTILASTIMFGGLVFLISIYVNLIF